MSRISDGIQSLPEGLADTVPVHSPKMPSLHWTSPGLRCSETAALDEDEAMPARFACHLRCNDPVMTLEKKIFSHFRFFRFEAENAYASVMMMRMRG